MTKVSLSPCKYEINGDCISQNFIITYIINLGEMCTY